MSLLTMLSLHSSILGVLSCFIFSLLPVFLFSPSDDKYGFLMHRKTLPESSRRTLDDNVSLIHTIYSLGPEIKQHLKSTYHKPSTSISHFILVNTLLDSITILQMEAGSLGRLSNFPKDS